jgi:hypothetical protein
LGLHTPPIGPFTQIWFIGHGLVASHGTSGGGPLPPEPPVPLPVPMVPPAPPLMLPVVALPPAPVSVPLPGVRVF